MAAKQPVGWTWTPNTRIRLADEDEIIARARRRGSVGAWIVERQGGWSWKTQAGHTSAWQELSSHHSETEALKAKARLDRKIAKEEG